MTDTAATAAAAALISILCQAVIEGRIVAEDVATIEDLDPYIDLSETGSLIAGAVAFATEQVPSQNDLQYAWKRADTFIQAGGLLGVR